MQSSNFIQFLDPIPISITTSPLPCACTPFPERTAPANFPPSSITMGMSYRMHSILRCLLMPLLPTTALSTTIEASLSSLCTTYCLSSSTSLWAKLENAILEQAPPSSYDRAGHNSRLSCRLTLRHPTTCRTAAQISSASMWSLAVTPLLRHRIASVFNVTMAPVNSRPTSSSLISAASLPKNSGSVRTSMSMVAVACLGLPDTSMQIAYRICSMASISIYQYTWSIQRSCARRKTSTTCISSPMQKTSSYDQQDNASDFYYFYKATESMAKVQINEDYTNHITEIFQPSGGRGGLYLGDQVAASNLELVKKYRITCVITIAAELDNKYPAGIRHKKISILDQPLANLYEHFDPCYQLMKKGLHEGNVLVHCRMGISRSASLVIAFLMRKYKCGYDKAFVKVKDRRPIVHPNTGFVSQLKQYDNKIKELAKKRTH